MNGLPVMRERRDMRSDIATLALLTAGVLSTLVLVGLPVFVGGIAGEFGWGDAERGWLASADMAGSALASLLVMRRIGSLDWRRATLLALVIVIAGNLGSILADNIRTLLAIRFTTGLGGGVVLSIAFTGLCHSRSPERYFGLYVLAQLGLQALLLTTLPALIAAGGMARVYVLFAAVAAASTALIPLFPRGLPGASGGADSRPVSPEGSSGAGAAIALTAQAIYFLAVAALWGYYEGIGITFGLDMAEIGGALAMSALAGIGGALAVILLGTRIPLAAALVGGTAISIAAAWLLLDSGSHARFTASACLFNFAWNYTFPYQMGLLSRFDRNGAIPVTSLLVQLGGLAGGPAIAALVLTGAGYEPILAAGIAGYATSLALFLWSARR